jgi:HPt (histidine-containing phosphotransfer) domain-containing protein
MLNEPVIIDIEGALNRALGDVAFLQMMFDEFQQMTFEIGTAISNALTGNDMQQLAAEAHQFKGAAANLGAMALASAASALEKFARSSDSAGAREAFVRMQEAIGLFNEHASQIDWTSLCEK